MIPGERVKGEHGLAAPGTKHCPRCGIDWPDTRAMFVDGAPCRDCRDVLVLEGQDRRQWWKPNRMPKSKAKARELEDAA